MDSVVFERFVAPPFELLQKTDNETFSSNNVSQPQSTQASPGQGAGPVLPPPSGMSLLSQESFKRSSNIL